MFCLCRVAYNILNEQRLSTASYRLVGPCSSVQIVADKQKYTFDWRFKVIYEAKMSSAQLQSNW